MELKTITLTYDEEVGILTLNRPERNNAWTGRMHAEYRFALASLADNDAVGAIVVTGGGFVLCRRRSGSTKSSCRTRWL